MYRILFLLVVTLFGTSFTFADNGKKNEVQEVKSIETSNVLGYFEIDYEDLSLPWTIIVPAPSSSDVIGIDGLVAPILLHG